jgi:hypothetical protein
MPELRAVPDPPPCPECGDKEHSDTFWSACWCACHHAPLTEGSFRKSFAAMIGERHLKVVR